jgi:thymidine phosphorylase
MKQHRSNNLIIRAIGIDTYRENIIYMRADCPVCKSEGFRALTRVLVHYQEKYIVATLNVVYSALLRDDEAALSLEAMQRLGVAEGATISVSHLRPIESFAKVRAKMYGKELDPTEYHAIIADVVAGLYSNIELASFITACSGNNMTIQEIIGLTRAMIDTSERIDWGRVMILDKHSVGGLPGNRTSPVVVSIVAAAGLTIPKTSSRAITSPAGTADTVEMITPTNLSIEQIKKTVEQENGCLAWGGAVKLSPADDILISVERALDLDSTGQMIASVLSKKVAAGSTHVLIDIPVGTSAKIRSQEEALRLQYYFKAVAESIGLQVEIMITDGSQPVGEGIGPALEAIDVLAVLRNESGSPRDLKEKSVRLAAALLELSGKYEKGTGYQAALTLLESGAALNKFMAICKAQGGFSEPVAATHFYDVQATAGGVVKAIDNRKLARLAKLAGAPKSAGAGIRFLAPLGKKIEPGDVLYRIYAMTLGELEYVKEYLKNVNGILLIE